MIPFAFMKTQDMKGLAKIAEKFYKANMKYRRDSISHIRELDDWCARYLGIKTYQEAVCAPPDELRRLKENLDRDGTAKSDSGVTAYVRECLYEKMRIDAKTVLMQWMEMNGILACPYCNHNYILYDSRVKLNTGQLDHYYPKATYPIFAASFFNLIPTCSVCNLAKSNHLLNFSPYDTVHRHDEIMNFRLWRRSVNEGAEQILAKDRLPKLELHGETEGFREEIKLLKLEALYQKHEDLAREIEKKRDVFSDAYVESMEKKFGLNLEQSKELLFGAKLNPDSFSQRPLSKFTYDILKEFDLAKGEE